MFATAVIPASTNPTLAQAADQVRAMSETEIRAALAERNMVNTSADLAFLKQTLAMAIAHNVRGRVAGDQD